MSIVDALVSQSRKPLSPWGGKTFPMGGEFFFLLIALFFLSGGGLGWWVCGVWWLGRVDGVDCEARAFGFQRGVVLRNVAACGL